MMLFSDVYGYAASAPGGSVADALTRRSKMKIQKTNLRQDGNTLRMQLKLPSELSTSIEIIDDMVLCGLIKFQIGLIQLYDIGEVKTIISIRLTKLFPSNLLIYSVKLNSVKLKVTEKLFFVVHDNVNMERWQIFCSTNEKVSEFDLALTLDVHNSIFCGFSSLHEDTELTDFELRGTDGSVKVHKTVLAGFSPVIKTMLGGQWRETNNNFMEVTNASKKTLQDLKDFMYLHKLPNSGIKELAVISSMYMMSDLRECCTAKLLMSMTAGNVADLLDFSVEYKMEKLKLGIMDNIQRGLMKVEDIMKESGAGSST